MYMQIPILGCIYRYVVKSNPCWSHSYIAEKYVFTDLYGVIWHTSALSKTTSLMVHDDNYVKKFHFTLYNGSIIICPLADSKCMKYDT